MPAPANVIPLPYRGAAQERGVDGKGRLVVPSEFGLADTTFGLDAEHLNSAYDAVEYFGGERAAELEWRGRFYSGTQHDLRPFDDSGRMIGPKERGGFAGQQQFLAAQDDPGYIPISARRPGSPYRVARVIVKSFTGLVYGMNRWPQVRSTDPDTQAFGEAIVKAANLANRFVKARNIAGKCGTAMLSWYFADGKPRVRVHGGRFCTVLKWKDVDALVPSHVTELYQTTATRQTKDGVERYFVWVRRDWTEEADIGFLPVEATGENPTRWEVDPDRTIHHGDGECHVAWLINFDDDDDPGSYDGMPDYDSLYESLTSIDELNSTNVRGVLKNIDPTLVLKVESAEFKRPGMVVQKGSEHALTVGNQGGAEYLTIPADVVQAGKTLIEMLRQQTLEGAQCVIPDPDKVAAAGSSSVALKMMYAVSINQADLLRETNGRCITLILEQMQRSARRLMGTAASEPDVVDEVLVEEPQQDTDLPPTEPDDAEVFENEDLPPENQDPEYTAVQYFFDLPDRVETEAVVGPDGKPTGETTQKLTPIRPGEGAFTLEWGDYFPPTATDKQAQAQAVATAAGGKPVLSQQSATEIAATMWNKDPQEEVARMAAERQTDFHEQQGMFPAPDGAAPAPAIEPPGGDGESIFTATDKAAAYTVNEERAKTGKGPLLGLDGQPDPDANLTLEEFRAKKTAQGDVTGTAEAEAATGTEPAAEAPPEEPLPVPAARPLFPSE